MKRSVCIVWTDLLLYFADFLENEVCNVQKVMLEYCRDKILGEEGRV